MGFLPVRPVPDQQPHHVHRRRPRRPGRLNHRGVCLRAPEVPGREKLFGVYVATLLIPASATLVPLFLISKSLHIYNTYVGLIFPLAFSAFGTFLMRQFFRTTPEELREAARLDGASELWIFLRVMLPLVHAGVAVLAVFTFIAMWGEFLWPLVATQNENLYTLNLGLSELQDSTARTGAT